MADAASPAARGKAPRVLAAQGLTLTRSEPERPPFTLKQITLSVARGEFVLLHGPSGSGKSSLLLALARLIPFDAGTLRLNGSPAASVPPAAWRARVAVVPAEPVMVEGSVADNLRLPWRFRIARGHAPPGDAALREGLEALGLVELEPGVEARRLSTGQLQRVTLLRALLMEPEFLLLDEPTANLDRASARKVWQTLERFRERTGCGVLCATHQQAGVPADRTLVIAKGTLKGGGR